MKKVLVAIDNNEIYNQIINKKEYDVYERDIVYKEGVLEYISKNKVDIIITRDDIEGNMIKEIYIKQIKLLLPHVKIILFVKEMDNKYLEFLYGNGIYDILESKENFEINKIISMMEGICAKNEFLYNKEITNGKESVNNISLVTKKKMAVFGTSGSGKSYVSSIIANMLVKKLNMKTLLLDFDVQNSAIDIYNNLNCSNNILSDIVKSVDNQTINSNTFENNVHKQGNLSVITNNAGIYECQEMFSIRHYEKIFEIAMQKYDVIVSDVVSNIFLDVTYYNLKNADVILFVISPNYISIRQAIKYLELLTTVWNVDKEKIKLVVNKVTETSLSAAQIESFLSGYKVCMQIEYDNNLENVINGISKINENTIKEDKEIYRIFGVDKQKYEDKVDNKKTNFLLNLFKKEGVV